MELRVFDGAVAIITGGASGIGRALAEALAARGADVVVADVQDAAAEAVAAGIRRRGSRAAAAHVDVADYGAVHDLVHRTARAHRRLDYLFNNAGGCTHGEFLHHSMETWNRILDVNLKGVIHGVQAAYPVMVEQGFGHIVNTASMQALVPSSFSPSYTTTKYAILGLSRSLRVEAASRGIRVSALCPGVVRTPLTSGGGHGALMPDWESEWSRRYFERLRPIEPDQFARKTLRQVSRNTAIIIVPQRWRVLWWLDRAFPALTMYLAARRFDSIARELRGLRDAQSRPGQVVLTEPTAAVGRGIARLIASDVPPPGGSSPCA
jgi:NAD(P)-dependent dehydrogenase (short-subunit alcohol dehydrogenase family)